MFGKVTSIPGLVRFYGRHLEFPADIDAGLWQCYGRHLEFLADIYVGH